MVSGGGELQSYKDSDSEGPRTREEQYVQMNKKLSTVVETARGQCKEEKNTGSQPGKR